MWILQCDGDDLQGKRIWLRPGKTYLFGRTRPEGGKYAGFTIHSRTVSRKHLTLSVAAVKPGAASLVDVKSELRLEDAQTKYGTQVDGENITGQSKVLKDDEHVFKLGSYERVFRINWQPVVLTFTFPSKDTKGKDPLIPIRRRLEDLDIKMIMPYITKTTTHVVASKRNTAKGLQALVNGKFIVDNTFLDAIVYAATPGNLDEPESLSALEEDFDKNWPPETDHLPAPGKEPGLRASELFAPHEARKRIFQNYDFVFCNLKQFENLQAPITDGGGKALLFPINMGQTSVQEVVRYVKDVAGEKDFGEFADGSVGEGVVLVKFQGDKGFEDWAANLQTEVAVTLDQRIIEQNEFLDAILSNDASKLRRALPFPEQHENGAPLRNDASEEPGALPRSRDAVIEQADSSQPDLSQALSTRNRPRGKIVSAFKGFDDGFDPARVAPETKVNGSILKTKKASNGVTGVDSDSDVANGTANRTKSARKRASPSDDEEDMNEKLLPAAAAMKRRKIEEEKATQGKSTSTEKQASKAVSTKPSKPRKEVDIQEVVRQRREAEEKARQQEEESFRETLNGEDISTLRNVAVVEEMLVPARKGHLRSNLGQPNNRWDEKWNGRKNFKKFRRSGEGGDAPRRRAPGVMVPLEEVKKKSQGIGEEYWLESDKAKKKKAKELKKEEDVSDDEGDEEGPFTTARSHLKEVPHELDTGGETSVIDIDAPRTTRLHDSTTQFTRTQDGTTQSESTTQSGAGNTQARETRNGRATATQNGKRPPPSPAAKGAAAKRQKVFKPPEPESGSEDDDDDLKFRFKSRR